MISRNRERPTPQAGIDRRTFLLSLGALGGLLALRGGTGERPPMRWSRLPYFPPNAINFLVINDVHYRPGKKERMAYEDALDRVTEIAYNLHGAPVDLVIQGGDLIQEGNDPQENWQNYESALAAFQVFAYPVLHLVGNHCRWGLSEEELSRLYQVFQMSYQPFTVLDYGDFQVVAINPTFPAKNKQPGFLPPEHVEELAKIMAGKRTLLFSHYDPFPQDTNGNYHFWEAEQSEKVSLANSTEIKNAWQPLPIEGIFSAHAHWTRYSLAANTSSLGKTHRVTLPSLTENLYGDDKNPGTYNLVSVLPDTILVQTYQQENCLFSSQLDRVR